MTWLQQLEDWDQQLFLYLNGLHTGFFDSVMYWVTYQWTWIPLFLLIPYLVVKKYDARILWLLIPACALLIAMTDQIHVHAFKEFFQRYRPCKNLDLMEQIHLVRGCGGKYGFVSGHATTSFAIAIFTSIVLRKRSWTIFIFSWAALFAYSRIYVGVHYPADITCGAILGLSIGALVGKLFEWVHRNHFDKFLAWIGNLRSA